MCMRPDTGIRMDDSHTYWKDGTPADYSLTSYINKFKPPFDREAILDKMNITDPVERAKVRLDWSLSAIYGTFVHEILEEVTLNGGDIDISHYELPDITRDRVISAVAWLQKILKELSSYKIYPELKFFEKLPNGYRVAGTADLVAVKSNELIIIDYKTSKSISKDGYGERFYKPLEKLAASKYNTYSLQLAGYEYLWKKANKNFNIKVKKLLMHIKPDATVELLPARDLYKQFMEIANYTMLSTTDSSQ